MKSIVHTALAVALVVAAPVFAAPAVGATQTAVPAPAHVKAVQDLLGVMHTEYVLRGVAGRTRFPSEAQRKAVFARLDKMPPAEVYQRLAPPLARAISLDTALEMTRFYNTPYGKKVIHNKFNSGPQLMFPGANPAVAPEEKKERKRAAYVVASKELADAEPAVQSEAFKLLQAISKETR
jgi:hypothetical protein